MDTAKPFLWGPVKNALLQEARAHGPETIVRLCFTTEQRVKEMMVQVLTDLGRDDLPAAEALLGQIFPRAPEPTRLQHIRQLVRPSAIPTDVPRRNARKIAIEVAGNLGLVGVLQAGARHVDPATRTAAVRAAYHLWERDPAAGFAILDHLADNVMHGLIPDLSALEVVFGLSLTIFFSWAPGGASDEDGRRRLRGIWRRIIDQVFGLKGHGGRIGQLTRDFIRARIFSFMITQCFRLLRELPAYNLVNYEDLVVFFTLGAEEKALYRRLIQYVDVRSAYSREDVERDCLAVLPVRSVLVEGALLLVLVAHGVDSPKIMLPFIRRFFDAAQAESAANPYLQYVLLALPGLLERDLGNDDAFNLLVYAAETSQDYYSRNPRIVGLNRVVMAPGTVGFNDVIFYAFQRGSTLRTPWLEEWVRSRIQAALEHDDLPFFEMLIQTQLPLIGIEWRQPQLALDTLDLFFSHPQSAVAGQIDEWIAALLARMRISYPDEVDDFLDEQAAPDALRFQVRTNEPVETVGELIGGSRLLSFFVASAVDSPTLRSDVQDIFARAADVQDLRTWLDYAFRRVINIIYGSTVL